MAPGSRLAVEVSGGDALKAGAPKSLFSVPSIWVVEDGAAWTWDLTANGQRFLFNTIFEDKPAPLTVLVNWQAALKKR